MNTQPEFFYAYDIGLITYLRKKGFRYITKAKHIKTDKIFAVFLVNDELSEHIRKWNEFNN
jgi:hypothetical protein